MTAIRERLAGLDVDHLPMPSVTAEVAEHLKFSDCLPTDLAMSVAAARLVDRAGVAAVVEGLTAASAENTLVRREGTLHPQGRARQPEADEFE